MKTKAAVLNKINEPLVVEELELPELKQGQVLVKISYSGICHSQLNEIHGLKGEDKFLPHTLGHEGSGVVEAIGAGVDKVKIGDRVVLTWIKARGADVPATSYTRKDGSIVNSGAISTFMTKAIVSENRLVRIPDTMPLREASLLGCAIPTGAGIVMNSTALSRGNSIAIFGIGGIGLSSLLAAKLKEASIIIAVDIIDKKLEDARSLGATHVINSAKQDVLKEILKITGNRGVDYAIESAGKTETMETAFKAVRDKGGECIIAGNLSFAQTIKIDPFDLIKGKRITGTWGGQTQPDKDIPMYADLAISGRLDLKSLICREYEIEGINEAIEYLERGASGRVLIKMEKL